MKNSTAQRDGMRLLRRRSALAAVGVALFAASVLVGLRRSHSATVSEPLRDLLSMTSELPHRSSVARVSTETEVDLPYRRPLDTRRGAADAAERWQLFAAAASIQQRLERNANPANMHEYGVAALLVGTPAEAVEQLQDAVRVSTGERNIVDAVHASTDPRLLTDLAAAVYEAGLGPGGDDDHVGIEAAERAWTLLQTPVIAWNRALNAERTHVREVARAAWQDYLRIDGKSPWADEARERAASWSIPTTYQKWQSRKGSLLSLVRSGRRDELRAIVTSFPQYVRTYAEDEVLPNWGVAELAHETIEADEWLRLGDEIGAALVEFSGDRTVADLVESLHEPAAPDRRRIAEAYKAFGDGRRHFRAQEIERAAAQFEAAERHARATRNPLAAHVAYQQAACLFMHNEYTAAANAAAAAERETAPAWLALSARIIYLRGLAAIQLGNADTALLQYRNAIARYAAAKESDSVALMRGRLADGLDHVGESHEAAAERMRALAELDRLGEPGRRDPILFDAADVALSRGWYATAQLLFTPIADSPTPQPMWRCAALLARSSALAAATQQAAAMRDYRLAREQCSAVPDARVRERLLASASILQSEATDEVGAIEESIEFLRRTRNPIWLPDLYRRLAKLHEREGDGASAEAACREGIASAQTIAASVRDRLQRESFQRHVDALFATYVALLTNRGAFHEALAVAERGRAGDLVPVETADLRARAQLLRDDVALVDIKVTARMVAIWVLTAKELTSFAVPVEPAKFGAAVERCGSRSDCAAADRARLYDALVKPWRTLVKQSCRSVVFVVDDELALLPFAVLSDGDRGQPLVADVSSSISRSIRGAFDSAAEYATRGRQGEWIVLVRPDHDARRYPYLAELPRARAEIDWLSRLHPAARTLEGAAATKARLYAEAADATILHFAGHAVSASGPLSSPALVLAPEETGPPDDLLHARELYGSNFSRLRLVVLAACATAGVGQTSRRGSVTVARGFQAAGIPVVVGTLWPVTDDAANAFSRAFHRALRMGVNPAAAVQAAQLEMIEHRDPELRKTSAWAGFTVCGAGEIMKGKSDA
ncbi:MAG TPA: CHAT domain-containing protein [Thermoanaerobaculia bacterium]|jgi:CHAT domain-containing protein